MKINTDVAHALQGTDKPTTAKSVATAPAAATTNSVGSVSISDASRSLAGTSDTNAPFDAKRVEQIKAAISSGHFKVNPEAIADKVIDSASQLLVGQADGAAMSVSPTVRTVAAMPATTGDDERSLLARFELLLEREERMLDARDADGLAVIADERVRLIERLADAVRRRRTATAADETELIDVYRRLRQRHELHGRTMRRRAERNASALRVLAQAAGRTGLYQADGSVRPQFTGG